MLKSNEKYLEEMRFIDDNGNPIKLDVNHGCMAIWIKCTYQLPEYGKVVLFVSGKNQISIGEMLPYEENTEIWATDNSIYFSDHVNNEICTCKSWMNLPPLPME